MILGFTGKMGVGKSTAVNFMLKLFEPHKRSELVKFAQPLYDMQEFIYSRVEGAHKRPFNFIKDRKLLQWLGTEWGRNSISETLWVDVWSDKVDDLAKNNCDVICDDVRFDNEAQMVKAMGGHVIQITSELTEKRIDTKSGISNHASEAGVSLEYVDYVIRNDGSLADFENSLAHVMNVIKLKQER